MLVFLGICVGLNPFVQVFYSNKKNLQGEDKMKIEGLNPFVQVFYSNKGRVDHKITGRFLLVLIPLFRSFILIQSVIYKFGLLPKVLIPLFRSFILILELLKKLSLTKCVLIPLFRSFILIRDKGSCERNHNRSDSLNPFVQVFYSNMRKLSYFFFLRSCLNPFVQVFYSNRKNRG